MLLVIDDLYPVVSMQFVVLLNCMVFNKIRKTSEDNTIQFDSSMHYSLQNDHKVELAPL